MSNHHSHSGLNSSVNHSKQKTVQKHCCNVMETLVIEEVERQIQALPMKTAAYVKVPEVVAYALNRLPSLYATSKRGWQRQWQQGKTKLSQKISTAVRQAIVAVQIDPLRVNDPLNLQEDRSAVYALEKLKVLLQDENLCWDNLTDVVEQKLLDAVRGKRGGRKLNYANHYATNHQTFDWNQYRL